MMRVDRAPTPRGFVEKVFRPGRAWLKANPYPRKVKDMWSESSGVKLPGGKSCSAQLGESFHRICAYSLFKLRNWDVEHCKPKQDRVYRKLAYCWLNYRLSDSRLNQRKGNAQLPDPFKVPINACSINFSKDGLLEVDRSKVGWKALEKAIERLKLNEGSYPQDRYQAFLRYRSGDEQEHIGIILLTEDSPFVAYEMLRQGHIRRQDENACRECLHTLGFSWV